MNTKTIVIIIAVTVVLFLLMSKKENTTSSNPQQINGTNNNNSTATTSTTTSSTSTVTQKQINTEELEEKYAIMVDDFLNTQNGCLPVYYWEYADLAKVPQNEWQYVKTAFRTYGKNFAQMYHKILRVSSKPCKTGFYKSEFNSIFDALAKRATW